MRELRGAADHLVAPPGIDPEIERQIHRLVKPRAAAGLEEKRRDAVGRMAVQMRLCVA